MDLIGWLLVSYPYPAFYYLVFVKFVLEIVKFGIVFAKRSLIEIRAKNHDVEASIQGKRETKHTLSVSRGY